MTSRPTTRNLQLSPLRRPPPSPSPPRSAVILATQPWSSFYSHARSLSFFFCCSFSIPLELCGFHSSVCIVSKFAVKEFKVPLNPVPTSVTHCGEWVSCSVGANFTPHIITVNA
ncbi:uncharacterized protein LOC130985584 isoform X3 [Salvia miltiorrhiza]|uniref:uncharacterized protein LOC130985584 isoform X3 n=1 Tax=Salvia miltiorrhiza TaxID=226208 RepID=UPI0025ACB345|nr:uncharacterized protein LOC130985584 isoform X3 [Salvia miltiorrhiza]XP_057764617.1 uncharacterized protein LOC130985584 isoform X3 [Salvia miltiorrhiza]XP_057764618.1 uncharacterized protein LOC130985584 isoform X3 [Salvia miltiorrhiza]XP_057764619.1 uncharacterized protein LOC130985584 isoform X3 [Salvia miltiorrhiza]XP_057764620.1 uncharacterized protein LOC130985584 isoform X3 [Salvia miltiorrhiza]